MKKTVNVANAIMMSYEAVRHIADQMDIKVKITEIYTETNAAQLALMFSIARA